MSGGGGGDSKSSGPSSDDNSFKQPLQTILAGPSGSSFGAGDGSLPGSFADSISGPRTATTPITGATFDAGGPSFDASGPGGFTSTNNAGASAFASVSDPTGASTGTADNVPLPQARPDIGGDVPLPQSRPDIGGGGLSAAINPTGGAPLGTTGASQFTSTADVFASPLSTTAPGAFGTSPAGGGGTSAPTVPFGASPSVAGGSPSGGGSGGGSSGDKPSFLDQLFTGATKSLTNNPLAFLGGAGMLYNAYQQNQALKGLPSVGASAGQIQQAAGQVGQLATGQQQIAQQQQTVAEQVLQVSPELRQQAQQLNAQGQQIASYLTSGTLPPGLQTALETATKDAKTAIISNYAARGMTTDPARNSVLAQELAAVDMKAVISTAQMGQQLMQTGLQEIGLGTSANVAAVNADAAASGALGAASGALGSSASSVVSGANLYKTLTDIDQSQQAQIQKSIAGFAAALTPTKSINIGTGLGS